jgi:hypothetical protein
MSENKPPILAAAQSKPSYSQKTRSLKKLESTCFSYTPAYLFPQPVLCALILHLFMDKDRKSTTTIAMPHKGGNRLLH